jgi:hypothetical protein
VILTTRGKTYDGKVSRAGRVVTDVESAWGACHVATNSGKDELTLKFQNISMVACCLWIRFTLKSAL